MIILAIDTGYKTNGYTIYDLDKKEILTNGTLIAEDKVFENKLIKIFGFFRNLIHEHKPSILVYENPIMNNRGEVGAKINRAIGLILYLAAFNKLQIFSYTATEVKKAVTGNGKADKDDIVNKVSELLNVPPTLFIDNHASDSAGILCTYLIKNNIVPSVA